MKVYNFSAGPAMLTEDVMKIAQAEFCDFKGSGRGLIELSHRGKLFTAVIERAVANVRELMNIGDDYTVLFIQGGASMQFAMVPMNLLPAGQSADYADTGVWADKACKEAAAMGKARTVCSSKADKYSYIPDFKSWDLDPAAAYLHITSNNTVAGTQYPAFPKAPAGVPMIADMSSDIMSRVIDVKDFGLIYAGAQKNLGPSGMALVIMRRDLAARTPKSVPTMLKYSTYMENDSLYNTPPTFGIYLMGLVLDWVKQQGGLAAVTARNEAKAALIYDAIDASNGFYKGHAAATARSRMNITFTLATEELEKKFLAEAKQAGFVGLAGHRSVGGCRASAYNSVPLESCQALRDLMLKFQKENSK